MKALFGLLLVMSLGLNVAQDIANHHLRMECNAQAVKVSAYSSVLDKNDAAENQRQDIAFRIIKRNPHIPQMIADQWARSVQEASNVYQINANLLLSLYQIESSMVHYDERGNLTISNRGAGGLGQIMPFWAKTCPYSNKPSDLRNGSVNIMCSAFILRHYIDQNKNNI